MLSHERHRQSIPASNGEGKVPVAAVYSVPCDSFGSYGSSTQRGSLNKFRAAPTELPSKPFRSNTHEGDADTGTTTATTRGTNGKQGARYRITTGTAHCSTTAYSHCQTAGRTSANCWDNGYRNWYAVCSTCSCSFATKASSGGTTPIYRHGYRRYGLANKAGYCRARWNSKSHRKSHSADILTRLLVGSFPK